MNLYSYSIKGFVLLLALAIHFPLNAETKALRLIPKSIPEIPNGKAIFIKGKTSEKGDRFFIEHLMSNQPVIVRVFSFPKNNIFVGLSKFRWDEFDKSDSTKETGYVEFKIRTQGEMRLVVRSDEVDTPYYAAVLVGNEVKPEMSPLVIPIQDYADDNSDYKSLITVILCLILVGLILVFLLKRRSK